MAQEAHSPPTEQLPLGPSQPASLVGENGQAIQPDSPPDKGNTWLPTALALVGFVAIIWTLLRSFRRNKRRGTELKVPPRERIERIRTEASGREGLDSLMADALELSQRLAAQLDTKAEYLEQLLARADQAIARLDEPHDHLANQPRHEPATDPGHRRVYDLADSGLDSLEIARRLDQPRGQVELILALRRA
ncbi:MAG: hypothetical protein H6811_02365 [Phycisphaeraceae bacterium]|nr:hypothetical protein [Phycisphaeraceae bacterium]